MKLSFLSAALLACAMSLCALPTRAQTTGTSHPEQLDDPITTAKPSPAVPLDQTSPSSYPNGAVQDYQPTTPDADHYVKPRHDDSTNRGSSGVVHQPVSSLPLNEQLADRPSAPAVTDDRTGDPTFARHNTLDAPGRAAATPHSAFVVTDDDPTSGVVMEVPARENEIPQATLLRAQLMTSLSTRTSKAGDHFTALLAGDVIRRGRVLLPGGSTLHGRISEAHGGHGINSAALRLEAISLTLPDGTTYPVQAEVVDVRNVSGLHVSAEGVIHDNAMTGKQAALLAGATGGGAVAGALVGGGVGAVFGATIGAGAGTVLYLRRDREQTLPAHSEIIFALDTPLELAPAAQAHFY